MRWHTVAARLVVGVTSLLLVGGCSATATPSPAPSSALAGQSDLPTPSPVASTSPSPAPSADASEMPPRASGAPGSAALPSPPSATRAAAWHTTGRTIRAHLLGTATLLRDGRVLLAGGKASTAEGKPGASAELYDPTTGKWSVTGSMAQARWGHTATLLADGRVLVTGGAAGPGCSGAVLSGCGRQLASAELYDPGNGNWAPAGSMHQVRSGHTATLLPDGRVLAAGGYDIKGAEAASTEIMGRTTAELYDPSSGQWTATGSMVNPRAGATATLLPDDFVLVAGGDLDTGRPAELYDPSTGEWTPTGSMTGSRRNHTSTLLQDGTVLVTGGFSGSDFTVDTPCSGPSEPCSAELYDPNSGLWTATGKMHADRIGHTATLLPDGTVLVVGLGTEAARVRAELYSPSTGRWRYTAGPTKTRGLTATLLLDGRVLATGNFSFKGRVAELYEPGVGR
jgi:hypothetical protein